MMITLLQYNLLPGISIVLIDLTLLGNKHTLGISNKYTKNDMKHEDMSNL